MFYLYTLEDVVRIDPHNLSEPTERVIVAALEIAFINHVVPNVGLVVSLYDIIKIEEGGIYHSDGGPHYRVEFRAVVFRPFTGELLIGTIKDMNETGIWVDLGFFSDVFVPGDMLQSDSIWHSDSKEWSWTAFVDDDTPPLYMVRGEKVRLKVYTVKFPPIPSLAAQAEQRQKSEPVEGTLERPHIPMEIVGRMDGPGLGMVSWEWGE